MTAVKEILPLTGLRFISALYVFIFHINIRWPVSDGTFFANILNQGAVGMSLFFMLSGFVLAFRYADGRTTLRGYLLNRVARIYPIYMAAAIVTVPWIGIVIGNSSEDIWLGVAKLVFLVLVNIFLVQAWFLQFFSYWNDGGSWSISVEAFCYLLLPFILPRLTRFSAKELYCTSAVCWVLAVLPGVSAKLFSGPSIGVFYSMPVFRVPEFVLGVCAYLAVRRGFTYNMSGHLQVAVCLCYFTYLGLAGPQMPLYVGHNWITLPVIYFMISSLSNGRGLLASLLSNPVLVWLGKISYCFYSFQVLLILMLSSYYENIVLYIPLLSNNIVLLSSTFLILVAIAALGYYLIEIPARRWIRRLNKYETT